LVHEYQQHQNVDVIINDDSHAVSCFDDDCTELAREFAKRHNIKVLDKITLL
jgi:hypothetical protein